MNSKSFPEKPLQCVPLKEILDIKTAGIQPNPNPNLKRQRSPSLFELEIVLRDTYGAIAQRIA
jgi:hypothetical protein